MIAVTAFTFFGLSCIQNLSYFTDLFDGQTITINIAAQEEENETSNNEEVKQVNESLHQRENFRQLLVRENSTTLLAFHHHSLVFHNGYLEVATPPPEL